MDLSQYGITGTSGSGSNISIPGLDGIQNTLSGIQSLLPTLLIVSTVATVLIVVLYILHIIRRWKVDKAIIETQKDVHAIRTLLENKQPTSADTLPRAHEVQTTIPIAPEAE
jgi:hypothetical protein